MDIARHLKEDPGCVATTLVDYYGLPQGEGKAWPGRARAATLPAAEKARCVEDAVLEDLATAMGARFDTRRFIPFVVMHEFEALLFSDCAAFSRGIGLPDLETGFQEIRDQPLRRRKSTIRRLLRHPSASRRWCLGTRSRCLALSPFWRSGWCASGRSVRILMAG
jgi:hypothetical protein